MTNHLYEAQRALIGSCAAFKQFCVHHGIQRAVWGDGTDPDPEAWRAYLRNVAMPLNRRALSHLQAAFAPDQAPALVQRLEAYVGAYEDLLEAWGNGDRLDEHYTGGNFPREINQAVELLCGSAKVPDSDPQEVRDPPLPKIPALMGPVAVLEVQLPNGEGYIVTVPKEIGDAFAEGREVIGEMGVVRGLDGTVYPLEDVAEGDISELDSQVYTQLLWEKS
jgi:hypothetical protein